MSGCAEGVVVLGLGLEGQLFVSNAA